MRLIRIGISLLLLMGIFTHCFSYWIISSSYEFNKNFLATVLCSNKSHPELHCDGKCFMDIKLKELAKKNKNEQNQAKRIIETTSLVSNSLLTPTFEVTLNAPIPYFLQRKPLNTQGRIFQPPKFS